MKKVILGVGGAVLLHAIVFLFGGALIPKGEVTDKQKVVLEDVDLAKQDEKKMEEEPKEKLEDPVEDIRQEMPDFRDLEQPAAAAGPALAAVSLSDLGSALSGLGGGDGGFGPAVGFGSGVIGGSGTGGFGGAADVLSSGQLDGKPQPTNRASPQLSRDQRQRAKGVVQVLLVVGPDGSVSKAEIMDSPDPSINGACLDAARQWRFQPGTRAGKAVSFKLKLPFRFE